jgi:hypothetical protein
MSRLTVSEKEHWKSRIECRVNKAIELLESKDPTLVPSIEAKAEREAHRLFGTETMFDRLHAIRSDIDALQTERDDLEMEMHCKVLGREAVRGMHEYHRTSRFNSVCGARKKQVENQLLTESETGREILRMRIELESLLDTVWLATTSVQIRDLWNRFSAALDDDVSPLQREVLTESPVCDE